MHESAHRHADAAYRAQPPRASPCQPPRHLQRRRSKDRRAALLRGSACVLAALLALSAVASRASAQPGTVIVELSTPPAARLLPAGARRTGATAAAQRVAHLGVASAAASAEQSSFHLAATAARVPFRVKHTYRYVSIACKSLHGCRSR